MPKKAIKEGKGKRVVKKEKENNSKAKKVKNICRIRFRDLVSPWRKGLGTLYANIPKFESMRIYENVERKGEIARNEQFLLFPRCFLFLFIALIKFLLLLTHLKLLSAKNPFHLRQSKISRLTMVKCPYNKGPDRYYGLLHGWEPSTCGVTRFRST